MATFEYQCTTFKFEVVFTQAALSMLDPVLADFMRHLSDFNHVVPIQEFQFIETAPADYDYKVKLVDGREWEQKIFGIAGDTNPGMTFDVPDQWKLTEFKTHNQMRESCMRLAFHTPYNITKLEVTRL